MKFLKFLTKIKVSGKSTTDMDMTEKPLSLS